MNKRIRKKHQVGEFTGWGVSVKFSCDVHTHEEVERFIFDLAKATDRYGIFQGLTGGEVWSLLLGKEFKQTGFFDEERDAVLAWLRQDSRVEILHVSPYFDAWHQHYNQESGRPQGTVPSKHPRRSRSRRDRRRRRAAMGLHPKGRVSKRTGRGY